MNHTRSAVGAGRFYPDRPAALAAVVEGYLRRAALVAAADGPAPPPKLLVVPHAGYALSGEVAAAAYARVLPLRTCIRRVVLLGPSHRLSLHGLAAPLCDHFETPLGRVPVDVAALAALRRLPQLHFSDQPHALEHALEVQLPFLQTVLGGGWQLLPLAVGDARPDEVAQVLHALWGGDETLVVVSSDLSHDLGSAEARARDQHTAARILAQATDLHVDDACGAAPLNGALLEARHQGLQGQLLDLRNSAETGGSETSRVVGYAAIVFGSPSAVTADYDADTAVPVADAALGAALLAHAHDAIAEALGLLAPPPSAHPRLHERGATFVSLHDADGRLRGCTGTLQAWRSLHDDVRCNARSAAFGDERFAPLTAAEWRGLSLQVALLGPLQALPAPASLQAAAQALQPGVDGVVLDVHDRRAVFLPAVWRALPEAPRFLAGLLRKAGLPADTWPADSALWRFSAQTFDERPQAEPRPSFFQR